MGYEGVDDRVTKSGLRAYAHGEIVRNKHVEDLVSTLILSHPTYSGTEFLRPRYSI